MPVAELDQLPFIILIIGDERNNLAAELMFLLGVWKSELKHS